MHKYKINQFFKIQKFIGIYLVLHFKNKCLGIQVDNLNLVTNLAYCWFHDVSITCKYTTLCKKLHYDIGSEPTYLTTNPQHSFTFPIRKMYRFQVPFVMHYVHNEKNWYSHCLC
jgi:hypothetical protein